MNTNNRPPVTSPLADSGASARGVLTEAERERLERQQIAEKLGYEPGDSRRTYRLVPVTPSYGAHQSRLISHCLNCGDPITARAGRGLCRKCWNDSKIRKHYPIVAPFGGNTRVASNA